LELSLLLLEQILAMVVMVLAGFVLSKAGKLTSRESQAISCVIIYILTPCALLDGFQTPMDGEKLVGLLASLLGAVVLYCVFLAGAWCLGRGKWKLTRGEQVSIVYSNSGNLIIPIILHTLGSEFVIYSCSYLLIQNLVTWTHGQLLLGGSRKLTVKQVATNPCICAIFLGLTLFLLGIQLPGPVSGAVTSLGACLGPVSMVVIGVMLAEVPFKKAFSNLGIYRVILLRLVICPVLAAIILWGMGRLWPGGSDVSGALTVTLLCAIGPSATTLTQMAQLYQNPESGYLSSINAVTTVLCAVTMPAVILFYQLLP
jgi:predicted permease